MLHFEIVEIKKSIGPRIKTNTQIEHQNSSKYSKLLHFLVYPYVW